ncbi:hypothetical protein [Paraburkholderia sp. MM5477-R1]|uniref:hypothetical protein n=1 Tax=Paraburkholderia sp. MM5477-R1 TaxID=2991062 RepID=UPI003D26270B
MHAPLVIRPIFTASLAAGVCIGPARAATANAASAHAADFGEHDFHFSDGTLLPAIRIHYVTFGTPQRNARGEVTNAVLLLHGTTGSSQEFLSPVMWQELFARGEPLDASRYFIVMPDGLGHGGSTKPSDPYATAVELDCRRRPRGAETRAAGAARAQPRRGPHPPHRHGPEFSGHLEFAMFGH